MTIVDLSDLARFDRRNLWQPDPRTFEVRPGMRQLLAATSGYRFCGGRSVKSRGSGELWHYVVDYAKSGVPSVRVRRLDENLDDVETLTLDIGQEPRAVSLAPLGNELVISSPDFPTVRALVGGHMEQASPVESANADNTTALEWLPRGLSVSWLDRVVMAVSSVQDGASGLAISDPGAPFTYVAQNFLPGPWASPVHGLHVSAEGMLIVCTETGVWAVPPAVVGGGQLLTAAQLGQAAETPVYGYEQTCTVRGAVWALTRKGIRQVWPPTQGEVLMDEQLMPRALGPRIAAEDYRTSGRMVGSESGPLVAHDGRLFLVDLATGHRGWWVAPNASEWNVRAVLHDVDGSETLLMEDGIYRAVGNMDGGVDSALEGGTAVQGYFAGRLPTGPTEHHESVRTAFKAQGAGAALHGLGGSVYSEAIPQVGGALEGVTTWESSTLMTQPVVEKTESPVGKSQGESGEVAVEVGASLPRTRIHPSLEVETPLTEKRRARRQ